MIAHTAGSRSMSAPLVQVKVHPPAGTILLNRPLVKNALSREMLDEIGQALDDLHQQRSVRAIIWMGSGSDFCSGIDLKEIHETTQEEEPFLTWRDDVLKYRDLLQRILEFPKPMIAAVHGAAMAGGLGLVLGCDVVLADSRAAFAANNPRRGLVAGMVAPLLMFRLGGSHAARMLVTAEPVDAAEAHRIGLVHEIVPSNSLWARGMEIARQCESSAPEAMQLTRRMLNETIGEQLTTLLATGAAVTATSRTTEAAKEGVAAFIEKRDPRWP